MEHIESHILSILLSNYTLGAAIGLAAALSPFIVNYRMALGAIAAVYLGGNIFVAFFVLEALRETHFPVYRFIAKRIEAIHRKWTSKNTATDATKTDTFDSEDGASSLMDRVEMMLLDSRKDRMSYLRFPIEYFRVIASHHLGLLLVLSFFGFYLSSIFLNIILYQLSDNPTSAEVAIFGAMAGGAKWLADNQLIIFSIVSGVSVTVGILGIVVGLSVWRNDGDNNEIAGKLADRPLRQIPLGVSLVFLGIFLLNKYTIVFDNISSPRLDMLITSIMLVSFFYFFRPLEEPAKTYKKEVSPISIGQKINTLAQGIIWAVVALLIIDSIARGSEVDFTRPPYASGEGTLYFFALATLSSQFLMMIAAFSDDRSYGFIDFVGILVFCYFLVLMHEQSGHTPIGGIGTFWIAAVPTLFIALAFWRMVLSLTQQRIEISLMTQQSMQSQFVAMMVHEISRPVGTMRSTLEFLEEELGAGETDIKAFGTRQEVIKRRLYRAGKAGRRISAILDEIRNYNKKVKPTFEHLSIDTLLEDCIERISHIEQDYPRVTLKTKSHVTGQLLLDSNSFDHIVSNLIQNAFQAYSVDQSGLVDVRLYFDPYSRNSSEEFGVLSIVIQDDGPGIPKDRQQQIFDPYYTTKTRGTGLGLALVNKLVQTNYSGVIRVISPLPYKKRGTRFIVRLKTSLILDSNASP